jgi:hypothetical protein
MNDGMIFSPENKTFLQQVCDDFNIQVEYKITTKPYLRRRPYREYCILSYCYKKRIIWIEKRYIRAGMATLKGRKYHFCLCDANPEVLNSKGEKYDRGPTEPHAIRKFVNVCMALIEMLNDDGFRNPHALMKIREYMNLFHKLEVWARQRIHNKYKNMPACAKGHQLELFVQ